MMSIPPYERLQKKHQILFSPQNYNVAIVSTKHGHLSLEISSSCSFRMAMPDKSAKIKLPH